MMGTQCMEDQGVEDGLDGWYGWLDMGEMRKRGGLSMLIPGETK